MNLTIVNTSTSIDDATFANVVSAVSQQVSQDFQPIWDTDATLAAAKLDLAGAPVPINVASDAIIYVGEKSNDPTTGVGNAFGYHSANYNNIAYGFVYLDVCQQYDEDWSCTLSHEVLELLADPTAVITVPGRLPSGAPVNYDQEVCDPTQSDTYLVNGVTVSNFVTKAYFGLPSGTASTNFLNLALQPFGVRPRGYLQYEDGAGAHEVNGSLVDARRLAARRMLGPYRRNERRKRQVG